MVAQPVEAVFVIYYGLTAHKATYGRQVENDTTYTKDYIQLIQDPAFREALERLFPRAQAGDKATAIEYRWPGGTSPGSIEHESADRPHLAWLKTVGAPRPWTMTETPSQESVETIPGTPRSTDSATANAQFKHLEDQSIEPYLLAIKLKTEPNVLHVRAYIDNAPDHLKFADTALLPATVRELLERTSAKRAFKWAIFDSHNAIVTPQLAAAIERLETNPTLLVTGPPGTGKTVLLEALARFIENPPRGIQFDPSQNHAAWSEMPPAIPGKVRSLVLHPSYTYENLVVGLLPQATSNGVTIRATTGPLVNLAHYASEPGRRALLLLDEFNRANAAAVLGDALALLDQDKRGQAFIDLPYSNLKLEVPSEFSANGTTVVEPRFTLPRTLWIVAAMNTSDRSVAPLDAALRRRFTIIEMAPDYEVLAEHLHADGDTGLPPDFADWTPTHVATLAVALLQALNTRIDAVLGPDFRLGHSHFWHVGGSSVETALLSVAVAFDHHVVPLLRLTLQDDDGALAAILRAGTPDKPEANAVTARWVPPDPDLGSYASDRLHVRELSSLNLIGAVLPELLRQAKL